MAALDQSSDGYQPNDLVKIFTDKSFSRPAGTKLNAARVRSPGTSAGGSLNRISPTISIAVRYRSNQRKAETYHRLNIGR